MFGSDYLAMTGTRTSPRSWCGRGAITIVGCQARSAPCVNLLPHTEPQASARDLDQSVLTGRPSSLRGYASRLRLNAGENLD